ncbi:MAG TPA: glycosyltransferase family 39 protein [Gemmataceae bacterium]|nr:glycosyltransferase family 39 protein [Gemmataceae bacterium]
MRGNTARFIVLLLIGSFAIRAAVVMALRDIHIGPHGIASADDVEFNNLALRVSQGKGYVGDQGQFTSFRAPGWPFVLAGLYWLAGPCVPLIYGVLCLLGAISCVLTYLLARELVEERTARIAGLLAAFYLPHIYFSAGFLSESLFVACLALGIWSFLLARKRNSLVLLMLAGLTLSWATLTRPFAVLLWPILLSVLGLSPGDLSRPRLLRMLAFTAAFFVCIMPWTLRNQRVHGHFVFVATNGGSTFYGGNNERVAQEFRQLGSWISTTELPHRDWIEAAPTELEHDKREWQLGLTWVRQHPATVPLLCVYKAARWCLWLPDFDGGSRIYYLIRILGYVPFLLLIIVGLGVGARRRIMWQADWMIVHGVMLATFVTALIFWGSPRFRDANMPFLMIYAAFGFAQFMSRQTVKQGKHRVLTPQTIVNTSSSNGTNVEEEEMTKTKVEYASKATV